MNRVFIAIAACIAIGAAIVGIASSARAATYSYRWLTQTYTTPTTPDTAGQLTLTVQNTGSVTWRKDGTGASVKLGTDNPRDRSSALRDSSWMSNNRVGYFSGKAQLDGSGNPVRDGGGNIIYDAGATTIAPGEAAHFVFPIHTPNYPYSAREYFNLVVDSVTWLPDHGVYWPVSIGQGYASQLVSQGPYPTIDKNGSPIGSFYFDYKNVGTFPWQKNGNVRLGTNRAQDRTSIFSTAGLSGATSPTLPTNTDNWLSSNRASTFAGKVTGGVLDTSATTIQPGETGRFYISLDARNVPNGQYREYFQLVADGFTWLFDYGEHPLITVTSTAPKVAAAGDVSCSSTDGNYNGGNGTSSACKMKATSDLLFGAGYSKILALGDLQYEDGQLANFNSAYNPTWGRVKASTAPVPGNHEYHLAGASGYFSYFGGSAGDPAKGYYSYDVGDWHIVALNSNCSSIGGCGAGSAQETWLRADLAAHPAKCTLAYWHHPRFSSGSHGNNTNYDAFWRALDDYDADVVLNGHDHIYERFHRQSPDAVSTTDGIREFVVGTGGMNQSSINTVRANSAVRSAGTFGVLELTLNSHSYDWNFRPIAGQSLSDSGSTACR